MARANSLNSMVRFGASVLLFAAAAALAGCGGPRSQPSTGGPVYAPPPPIATAPNLPPPGPPPSPDGKIRVAILLPLSGDGKDIGQGMLDAAQMALFDLGKKDIVLLPLDSGGSPEQAISAARQALDQGAQIILGPLFSTSTQAIAPMARAANVSIISFSNDPAVAAPGVFVMGFTVGPQVQRVTNYAISQNMQRLTVIAPNSSYGQTVVGVMDETARARGASLQTGFFDAQAPDVTQAVTAFAQSSGGAQAVMVPVGGARLSVVAPLLATRGMDPRQVKYLGTGLWDVPNIWREGALLGAWYAAPPPEARVDFEKRFNEAYGRRPPRLATLAYDAVALVGALASGPGSAPSAGPPPAGPPTGGPYGSPYASPYGGAPRGPDFSPMAIANPNGFAGVDGIFRFTPDGQPQRGLAVLEITRDGIKTVSPAPTSFQQLTN